MQDLQVLPANEELNICGLFGFVGTEAYEMTAMLEIASLAATRGPHSHGWAWATNNEIASHRASGDARNGLKSLADIQSTSLIGHSRLATSNVYATDFEPELEDTMPFVVGDIAICHNGNVRDHSKLAESYGFEMTTGCDSEVIAHLLWHYASRSDVLPLSAHLLMAARAIEEDDNPYVIIAMNGDGEMAVIRRGLPLYLAVTDAGYYVCSREPQFGKVSKIKEGLVMGWPSWTIAA